MKKQFWLALLACGVLVGLGGCSEGDDATINIEAPDNSVVDNSTTNNSSSGSDGSDSGSGDSGSGSEPATECPAGTTTVSSTVCALPATISSDVTLTADFDYLMEGRVTVGNGNGQLTTNNDGTLPDGSDLQSATLTIEAGVEIKGKQDTFANLIITRGSKIMAMGTKSAPIIMSSEDDGYDGAGEWGGLIIHGLAPHNECEVGGTYCDSI